MFLLIRRLLGWIFGTLFALVIVVAVGFFERRLRFRTRRDPAWRSRDVTQPALPVGRNL